MKKETVLRLSRLSVSALVLLMGVGIALLLFVDVLLFVVGLAVFGLVCDLLARAYVKISEMETGSISGDKRTKKDAIYLK